MIFSFFFFSLFDPEAKAASLKPPRDSYWNVLATFSDLDSFFDVFFIFVCFQESHELSHMRVNLHKKTITCLLLFALLLFLQFKIEKKEKEAFIVEHKENKLFILSLFAWYHSFKI